MITGIQCEICLQNRYASVVYGLCGSNWVRMAYYVSTAGAQLHTFMPSSRCRSAASSSCSTPAELRYLEPSRGSSSVYLPAPVLVRGYLGGSQCRCTACLQTAAGAPTVRGRIVRTHMYVSMMSRTSAQHRKQVRRATQTQSVTQRQHAGHTVCQLCRACTPAVTPCSSSCCSWSSR